MTAEIIHHAKQSFGADSARVFSHCGPIWSTERRIEREFYYLSVKTNGTSKVVGRRETLAELLQMAERGPLVLS